MVTEIPARIIHIDQETGSINQAFLRLVIFNDDFTPVRVFQKVLPYILSIKKNHMNTNYIKTFEELEQYTQESGPISFTNICCQKE
jgi:hypothetical protein